MKVLIIGSKGFIGSHLLSYFKEQYNDVYSCDVHSYHGEKNYFQIDPTNSDFTDIFKQIEFNYCINCSGAASVPDSVLYPHRDFALNTLNVFKLLDAIRIHNSGCSFINFSSAAVYGNPTILPIKETSPYNPVSPYGYHKMQAEIICKEFAHLYKLKTCSVRVFSAYGPGLKKQLFWDLFQKSINNSQIELFGTGNESRDFIYIEDLVKAIHLIALNAEMQGECINVANGTEISIETAVKTFFSLLDSNHEIRFLGNTRTGDPINWRADIEKLKSMGYSPENNITQGLTKYVKWIKELK